MKKKIVLALFTTLYFFGAVAAVVILAQGSQEKESRKNTALSSLSSMAGLNKKSEVIGLIKINTPISFVSSSPNILVSQQRGASYWLEQMNYAVTNDTIKAVIIQVNSPGGTVGASQELYDAVQRIKDAGKPVITSIADLSASGGYYATVSSDRIFANPGSLVGSIGVILGGVEFSSLLKKIGIKYQAITSGKNKDILSPYKELTAEQRTFLQTMVDNTYEQFLTAVADGRKRSKEEIRPLADGSIFTGEQAVENGLIDEVGSFYDAVEYTKQTYNLPDASVELISPQSDSFNLTDLISIAFSSTTPEVNLINTEPSLGYAPVLYLYQF